MSVKKSWSQWVELFVSKTGKCPGNIPSFGLPDDLLGETEFKQSISGMPFHDAKSCNCWTKKEELDIPAVLSTVKQIISKGLNKQLRSGDNVEALLNLTERNVRERTVVMKQKIAMLVDRISVNDFRVEDGKVSWKVNIPNSLFTIFESLKGLEPPKNKDKTEVYTLPPGVEPLEKAAKIQ